MSLWHHTSRNVVQYRRLLLSKASRIQIFNQSFSQQDKSIWTDLEPNITVNPKVSLVDEGLIIKASGLSHGQPVTIKAETQIGSSKESLISLGCYEADETGCVSTSSQPSLGGTYQGIEPLGPIWSMTSTSTRIPFGALEQDHGPDRPLNIKFSLLNGHVGHNQTRDDIMSDDCDITRGFMAGNIQRTPFKEGPMEGMLYAPTDRGSQPLAAILDFRGAEESHREHLPALLASHGYVTMTTRYPLQTDTLVNINCLEQLYHRLASHHMVDERRIGGLSRGDGVAVGLNFAAHLNHLPLQCLLGVNGVSFNTNFGWILPNGTKTSFYPYYERSKSYNPTRNGSVSLCSQFEPYRIASILSRTPDCFVPVENIDIPLMMFSSRGNPYLPSQYSMEELKHRLCHAGRSDQLELIEYSDSGHLLDPTYISHIQSSHGNIPNKTDGLRIAWGGETTTHARSQRDMWERTLGFFKRYLQTEFKSNNCRN